MPKQFRDLFKKSDEELKKLMESEDSPETPLYRACLDVLLLRRHERLIAKTEDLVSKTWWVACATWSLAAVTIIIMLTHP